MFVRNSWYVAAWDHEIGRHMLRRIILDQPVVLYRTLDGKPVALEDRCCHRQAPSAHSPGRNPARRFPGADENQRLHYSVRSELFNIPLNGKFAVKVINNYREVRVKAFGM